MMLRLLRLRFRRFCPVLELCGTPLEAVPRFQMLSLEPEPATVLGESELCQSGSKSNPTTVWSCPLLDSAKESVNG